MPPRIEEGSSRYHRSDHSMEDGSLTDTLLQQQMEARQQQQQPQVSLEQRQQVQAHAAHRHQQQTIHPAPVPYPAPPNSSNGGHARHPDQHQHNQQRHAHHAAVRHNSASQASDTLRRRSVAANNNYNDSMSSGLYRDNAEEGEASVSGDADFRISGLEMPSTTEDHDMDVVRLPPFNENFASRSYYNYHSNGGASHNARLNASLTNIDSRHVYQYRQQTRSMNQNLGRDEEDQASIGSASSRRRQSNLTPQHQLDRRNSRRRVTKTVTSPANSKATISAPNRYYISGKSVQTEWSSPTRQRRSRNSISNNSGNRSRSHADQNILVLPSIAIPNGSDDYRHLAQVKPPTIPTRRACVQASSVLCSFGTFKWCVLIQILLGIPLCLYVFDAHAQKKSAKIQLQQYNEEHEHILNQMMWMDQAAKKMKANAAANVRHRTERSAPSAGSGSDWMLDSFYADNSATEDLRDSVHRLRSQMRDMQYRIQQNSKARITEKYGEGPIRIYIHPEPEDPVYAAAANKQQPPHLEEIDDNSKQIDITDEVVIELFIEDTPHAVSTFLYQIERGHWNRVQMNWRSETSILSKPGSTVTTGMGDWAQTSRLEFLEQFPIKHCEVALVQQGQMGVLSLKINLVEVPFKESEEVCVGRILNDNLAWPNSREYFMAEFSTTSKSDLEAAKSRVLKPISKQQRQYQDEKHSLPLGAEGQPILEEETEDQGVVEEEGGVPPEKQVVPPLEDPGATVEDIGGL